MPLPAPEPEKPEELEELSSEHLKEEPPPVPEHGADMREALDSLKELGDTREDAEMRREREEASAAATAEIRKAIEDRDKKAIERMRQAMGAKMLHELPPEDVRFDIEGTDTEKAIRALGPRKTQEPPPLPPDARKAKPAAKKPWYKRLFGR